MPPSLNVAMSALTVSRSGVGNAVLQALRQVGGAIGVAVLGTVLNTGYRHDLPVGAPAVAREGVAAGAAASAHDAALLAAVRAAFVHGMDWSLVVAGSAALVGVVLALIFVPRASGRAGARGPVPGPGRIGPMTSVPSLPPAGLRERKKAKTRAAIREAAMTLFEKQGYPSTTVEQIAEAAEVSPSTFFRYFPTKEDVVLADDWDPPMAAAILAQPPDVPAPEALIAGMRAVVDAASPADRAAERRRQRLFQEVPELRVRYLQQLTAAIDLFASVLAQRAGRTEPDLESRAVAGAMIGVAMALMPQERGMVEPIDIDRYEEGLKALQKNLGPRRP
jgi:AcrR family transcriptional regulator